VIVVDACVLIAHLVRDDALHARATSLLESLASEPFGTSPISLAEVLARPARAGRLERTLAALRTLDITQVGLADDAPARLADLRAITGLKLPDCCVLLNAETSAADIATFDDGLGRAAQARAIAVHG